MIARSSSRDRGPAPAMTVQWMLPSAARRSRSNKRVLPKASAVVSPLLILLLLVAEDALEPTTTSLCEGPATVVVPPYTSN